MGAVWGVHGAVWHGARPIRGEVPGWPQAVVSTYFTYLSHPVQRRSILAGRAAYYELRVSFSAKFAYA